MPLINSSSIGSLISVEDSNFKPSDEFSFQDDDFNLTNILIPSADEFDIEGSFLPLPSSKNKDLSILSQVPFIVESNDMLLSSQKPLELNDKMRRRTTKLLNICQGEVGHAISSQCDIIASDDATTCHIIALRSTAMRNIYSKPLSSIAHIDRAGYEDCIRDMLEAHKDHHRVATMGDHVIDLDLHLLGGFNDHDGQSREISMYLLTLFAQIAEEELYSMRITLRTCAISELNDNGNNCPIGRGLGMNTKSGHVFLVNIDRSIAGPALVLRGCRLWSASANKKLHVVHRTPSSHEPSTTSNIIIEPFKFFSFRNLKLLLSLPDHEMIKYISTSPLVEKDNYCANMRQTLMFIQEYKWSIIFGNGCNTSLSFRRTGNNEWEQM